MGGGLILYVHPAFPLLALLSGAGVQHLAEHLNRQKGKTALLSVAIIGSILIVVTVTAWHVSSFRFSKRDQQEYSIFPHVRYFQMARLQRPIVADKISSYIEMASDYKSKIFGHPTITTLVALKSERHIACEFADLDPAWIKMGIISRESIVECIEKDNVQFYISPAWFLIIDPYFKKYLQQCYKPPIIFPREPGSGIPRIFVFKHLEGPTPCIPDVLAKKTDEKYSCP
jgi:hypothetical protein